MYKKTVLIKNSSNRILTPEGIAFELKYMFDKANEKLFLFDTFSYKFCDFVKDAERTIGKLIYPKEEVELIVNDDMDFAFGYPLYVYAEDRKYEMFDTNVK